MSLLMRNYKTRKLDLTVFITKRSLLTFPKYGGELLEALRNLNPSLSKITLSNVLCCFKFPAFWILLLHFLSAIWDWPKRIFICDVFVLQSMFSTHLAGLLFELLSSDL